MSVKMKFMSWTWHYMKEFCSLGVRLETVQMLCVLFIHMTLLIFDKVKTLWMQEWQVSTTVQATFQTYIFICGCHCHRLVSEAANWVTVPSQKWTPSPLPKRTEATKAKWVMNMLLSGIWHCRLLCNACTLLPEYVASYPRRHKAL